MAKYISIIIFYVSCMYAQTDVSGNISSNITWSASNSPYNITGSIGIPAGYTITIEPGVTVNYTDSYQILVLGSLVINGSSGNKVTFNSSSANTTQMIMFKSTDLSNSSIGYTNFVGPQTAIQLASESEHSQDATKNSDTLRVQYSDFSNTAVYTDGYSTTAGLIISNSTFSSSTIKGYYPRTEPIILKSCTINNSTINSDSYNKGIKLYSSTVTNSQFTIGCCGANFVISSCNIYNSPFSQYNNYFDLTVNNSVLVKSPIEFSAGDATITNSIISYDGSRGIYSRSLTMSNCTITGNGTGTGVETYSYSNYTNSITNSTIINNATGIKVSGDDGTYTYQSNNWLKN